MMSQDFLPFALPSIGEEEIAEVVDSLRSGWWTSGPKTQQFEQEFAASVGAPHALAVNSATAGLHLALEAIGIQPGDEILTSPYTFTATAEVMRYLGAHPVFCDIDPNTFNLDVKRLPALIEQHPKLKAIMPVHFAGQACDMDPILALAKQHHLKVVEDAAHTMPATYKGRQVGTLGDLTVYSFYVTKPIATGEGGMVVTARADYAQRIRTMRLHGINRDTFERTSSRKPSWYYEVVAPGFKYNMTDVAASIGIHQLRKANQLRERREAIAHRYERGLRGLPLRTPQLEFRKNQHSWHLYVLQLELEQLRIDRDRFIELMREEGIGTSVHFIPLHIQPYWRDEYGFLPDDFPLAWDVYQRAVSLPIYPAMRDADVERVIAAVRAICARNQR